MLSQLDEREINYKRVLKENEELKKENDKLREIKNTTDYGIETVNLIPKSALVEINTNRYMIEIEDGKFVDLKQVYQDNETLKKLHIQDNKHLDFIIKNSIPIQKVKDKIEELKAQYKTALEENSTEAFILKCQIIILQELIEEREEE